MIIPVTMKDHVYDVVIKRNSLNNIEDYLNLNRKVLIVTDDGIPSIYVNKVLKKCNQGYIYTIKQGEESKNFTNYENILNYLMNNKFIRTDCIIAIGGGVVGDLAGFVASTYMRGICFYNIPTTLLSQVDSSVGGKTAIDKNNIKNIVGTFYPPHKVVIDSTVLETLSERQLYSGLAESIKMGLTSDASLYYLIDLTKNLMDDIDEVIYKSIMAKKKIVEEDPTEKGIRKVLNYGHTVGHAIESSGRFKHYFHGECVSIGMLYFCNLELKDQIKQTLHRYHLPSNSQMSKEELIEYIMLDKKRNSDNKISIVYVNEIGSCEIRELTIEDIKNNYL